LTLNRCHRRKLAKSRSAVIDRRYRIPPGFNAIPRDHEALRPGHKVRPSSGNHGTPTNPTASPWCSGADPQHGDRPGSPRRGHGPVRRLRNSGCASLGDPVYHYRMAIPRNLVDMSKFNPNCVFPFELRREDFQMARCRTSMTSSMT
jgi:hypothetical protein